MERVREYLDGLEIQDPRHLSALELSDRDRNKYQPILTTDGSYNTEVTAPPRLPIQRVPLEESDIAFRRETPKQAISDTGSIAPSRSSNNSVYSSCFSDGRRSASTARSSCTRSDQGQRLESLELPPIQDKKKYYYGGKFSQLNETLHEEHIAYKETRDFLVTKPNPAFLKVQEVPEDRALLVVDDLEKEKRFIEREKRRERIQVIRLANLIQEEVPPSSDANLQVPFGKASHDSLTECYAGEAHLTHTSCNIIPSISPAEGSALRPTEICGSRVFSQISSQADSISSEDDTDWEEDSEAENPPEITRFLASSDTEENLEFENWIVRNQMTPMRSRVLDRLMAEFWAIFKDSWSTGRRQICVASDGASQTTSTSASDSGAISRSSSGVRQVKRSRGDGDDEEQDDRSGRRRKRIDKLPAVDEDDSLLRQFSCPYRKRDPRKYSVQEWPRCALKPQKTIARLKAHLYQYHLIQQCLRCKSIFESEEELEAHIMTEERCDVKVGKLADGITRKMKDQIQCRKKSHPGQTEAGKWERIYKIIFPNEVVPDPYFEPISDHDIIRPQSPDSVNLADYEAYLRRVLPNLVQNALEVAIGNEFQPIETHLQRRMMEIIQDAQNQAFSSFRNMQRSEPEVGSPARQDRNQVSAMENDQSTTIETFFQPPPPTTHPISFTNLSELRAQQSKKKHNTSDSGYASNPPLSSSSHHNSLDAFFSDTDDQMSLHFNVPMDSLLFDAAQYLNFEETELAPSNDDFVPTQLQAMTEEQFDAEPRSSYFNHTEMTSFEDFAVQDLGETQGAQAD